MGYKMEKNSKLIIMNMLRAHEAQFLLLFNDLQGKLTENEAALNSYTECENCLKVIRGLTLVIRGEPYGMEHIVRRRGRPRKYPRLESLLRDIGTDAIGK